MARATGVGAAAAAVVLLAAAPRPAAAVHALTAPGPADLAGPLVAAAALLAWLLSGWLVVTAVLTLGSRTRGPAGTACAAALRRTAPAVVRRAVALSLGLGVVLGSAGTAGAAPAPRTGTSAFGTVATSMRAAGHSAGPVVGGVVGPVVGPVAGPVAGPTAGPTARSAAGSTRSSAPAGLDWPGLAGAALGTGDPPPAPRANGSDAVVVRPGDTLWGLAKQHLPAGSPPARVARAWPAWWAANRAVIGDDPALLRPGQQLQPPTDSG